MDVARSTQALSSLYRWMSAHGSAATEIQRHQQLHGNPAAAMAKVVDAKHLADIFAIQRAGRVGIRIRNKQAHPLRVGPVFGSEVDAVARNVRGWQDLIELVAAGVRRPDANDLREFQTCFASALLTWRTVHNS